MSSIHSMVSFTGIPQHLWVIPLCPALSGYGGLGGTASAALSAIEIWVVEASVFGVIPKVDFNPFPFGRPFGDPDPFWLVLHQRGTGPCWVSFISSKCNAFVPGGWMQFCSPGCAPSLSSGEGSRS